MNDLTYPPPAQAELVFLIHEGNIATGSVVCMPCCSSSQCFCISEHWCGLCLCSWKLLCCATSACSKWELLINFHWGKMKMRPGIFTLKSKMVHWPLINIHHMPKMVHYLLASNFITISTQLPGNEKWAQSPLGNCAVLLNRKGWECSPALRPGGDDRLAPAEGCRGDGQVEFGCLKRDV